MKCGDKKKLIRLKLSDFINSTVESDVIDILKTIQAYSKINIILWHNDELNTTDINKFRNNYSDLFSKGNVIINNHNVDLDFIWYDIQNSSESQHSDRNKFTASYTSKDDMIIRLMEVANFVRFSNNK